MAHINMENIVVTRSSQDSILVWDLITHDIIHAPLKNDQLQDPSGFGYTTLRELTRMSKKDLNDWCPDRAIVLQEWYLDVNNMKVIKSWPKNS